MIGLMHKYCLTIPLPSSADILGKHEHSQIEVSYSIFESLSSQSILGLHPVYNVSMTRFLVYSHRTKVFCGSDLVEWVAITVCSVPDRLFYFSVHIWVYLAFEKARCFAHIHLRHRSIGTKRSRWIS